jgi:glucokinase
VSEPLREDEPRLLAEIGTTQARFAVERTPGRLGPVASFDCGRYAGLPELVRHYLAGQEQPKPKHAAIAIANPIDGDLVRMTNRAWEFSIEEARRELELETLLVVNDFTALAQALPRLGPGGRRQVGGGEARSDAVIGVLGPGAGLGVSGLIPAEDGWITLGSEGGHASFAPNDERELRVLKGAWGELEHVSFERLLSTTGLELIHRSLGARRTLPAADVIAQARKGDPAARESVDCFCAILATAASDLALTLGALGGIYLGGSIVPRLGKLFDRSAFRRRFESKGRFSSYLARIPTYVITEEHAAFLGISAILGARLGSRGGASWLDRIRQARGRLSPAEAHVAEAVLAHPRAALTDPVNEIARKAGVSQPTVIRFCRSLGCEGLPDFKLKLASALTGTIPVRHSQVRIGDAVPDLSAKVLDNTVSAIIGLRERLNAEALAQAIRLVREARHIELYGIGDSSVVALDGQHKFFRFRIPTTSRSDPGLQALSAELLAEGDVVIAISHSGRTAELLHAVDLALAAGASVIAITAGASPLAKRATVTLAVDHVEEGASHIAMVSRILHLLMIDVLAVGVAMSRQQGHLGQPDDRAATSRALISHTS